MSKISFIELYEVSEKYYPKPAIGILPEWYKKTNPYIDNKKHPHGMTIKRCIPVFDAMTSGYILPLHADLFVNFEEENGREFQVTQWSQHITNDFVQSHGYKQFEHYPDVQVNGAALKYVSPFAIVTPPGYSCLFTQPLHQDSSPIKIFEGVVDTDKQHTINFPFAYKDPNYQGTILAGTPFVQIIPFKRESWKMSINDKKDTERYNKQKRSIGANIFGQYRDFYWNRKEYK